jgi:hypothetical protein
MANKHWNNVWENNYNSNNYYKIKNTQVKKNFSRTNACNNWLGSPAGDKWEGVAALLRMTQVSFSLQFSSTRFWPLCMIIRSSLLFGICPPSQKQLQHYVSKASCISNLMCKPKQVDALETAQCLSVALSKGSTTQVCAQGWKQSWLLKCSAVTV